MAFFVLFLQVKEKNTCPCLDICLNSLTYDELIFKLQYSIIVLLTAELC